MPPWPVPPRTWWTRRRASDPTSRPAIRPKRRAVCPPATCKPTAGRNWPCRVATAPARPVGAGFSPLDEELGLLPGSLTPHLLELLVRLGAWLPFAPAAELLVAFTGVACSAATARRQTEAAGTVLVAQQTAAAPALAPPADPGPPSEERLLLSADGAMVALTDGTWAEVRTAAIGRVSQEAD